MTSPWPEPDYKNMTAMCCICFGTFPFADLTKDENGVVVDVCYECRALEVLQQIATKLAQDRKMIGEAKFDAAETELVVLSAKIIVAHDKEITRKIANGEVAVSW